MTRARRLRLRSTLTLLVLAAMLWSQAVLARHAFCSVGWAVAAVASSQAPDCHPVAPSVESVLCDSHCSQGDLTHDLTRGLGVPMLGPAPTLPTMWTSALPRLLPRRDATPPRSWHRPTRHPASLLLI